MAKGGDFGRTWRAVGTSCTGKKKPAHDLRRGAGS
jgi:hypothetical protein